MHCMYMIYAVVCILYRHTYAHVLCVYVQSYVYYADTLTHMYCMYMIYAVVCI